MTKVGAYLAWGLSAISVVPAIACEPPEQPSFPNVIATAAQTELLSNRAEAYPAHDSSSLDASSATDPAPSETGRAEFQNSLSSTQTNIPATAERVR